MYESDTFIQQYTLVSLSIQKFAISNKTRSSRDTLEAIITL